MGLTLQKLLTLKEERKKILDSGLDGIIRQLKDIGALKIIVFGSYVSDTIGRWSDLDILVIMPPTKTGREWTKIIYDELERGVACDILCYTQEEFEATLPVSAFLRHAVKTGRIVYEKD